MKSSTVESFLTIQRYTKYINHPELVWDWSIMLLSTKSIIMNDSPNFLIIIYRMCKPIEIDRLCFTPCSAALIMNVASVSRILYAQFFLNHSCKLIIIIIKKNNPDLLVVVRLEFDSTYSGTVNPPKTLFGNHIDKMVLVRSFRSHTQTIKRPFSAAN